MSLRSIQGLSWADDEEGSGTVEPNRQEGDATSWNPRRLLAPTSTPHLERTADVIGCFINCLGLIWGVTASADQWIHHQLTPRDTAIVGTLIPVTAVTTAWIVVAVVSRRSARLPLVVHTAQSVCQVLVFGALWEPAPGQLLCPLSFPIELAAAASWACVAWPVCAADLLVTLTLGGIVAARTGAMGPTDALVLTVGNSVFYAAIGMVAAMAWTSIVKAVELSRRASEESAESGAELLAAQEAAAASNRWDSVIHDHVLNALRAAARGATTADWDQSVRILAREALVALRETAVVPGPVVLTDRLRAAAQAMGLALDLDIEGEPPAPIAKRVVRAAEEALANVSRHSGVSAASVTGRFSPEYAELVVRDEGSGFDPARVPEGRHGLQGSIIGAMETRGGSALIDSAPGRGTAVTLTWNAPGTRPIRLSGPGSFRAMVVFLALTVTLSLSLGWVEHTAVVRVGLQAGLSATLIGAAVAAFLWHPLTPAVRSTITMTTVCCQVLMLGNLRPGAVLSWQEWFIGFGIGVFAPMAWRTRSRRWVVVVAGSWPLVTIGGALISGAPPVGMMLGRASSYTWPLILSFAASWAATSMRMALDAISRSRAETLDTVRARVRADAALREAERRLAMIRGEPMEMLEYLAGGGKITEDVGRRCELLEASTRDLLVAPFIVDDAMRYRFFEARRRGVRVMITGEAAVPEQCAETAEAFRRICVIMADDAGEGDRLTCRWHSGGGGTDADSATVALVGEVEPGVGERCESAIRRVREAVEKSSARIDVMDAEGDLLVTIGR